jgi:hypothetical protein
MGLLRDTVSLSLLDAVVPTEGFDPDRVTVFGRAARAAGAAHVSVCDLGPALAATGLAYATHDARLTAQAVLQTLARASHLPLLAPGPEEATAEAEAAGLAPLPSLVVWRDGGRRLSRAAVLAIPHELLPAARTAIMGHGALPHWLTLVEADRAAIAAALPEARSIAHAAALAGRLAALERLDADALHAAEAFAFGTDEPPKFLPEAIAAALTPGASAEALAAMADACRKLLAEAPFLPAATDATTTRLPRAKRPGQPAPLPLFPDAPAAPAPAALRAKNLRLVG